MFNNHAFYVFLYRVSFCIGFLVILIVNVFRFYSLNDIPYGAQVDELAGAVTVQCLATEGIDAHNRSWPLFSDLNFGTPKPPTYLYPAVLWTKFFGFSIGSFRALTAFFFVLALLGLLFVGRRILDREYGFWALLLGSISPWAWNLSRVSFESLSAVTFIIWGLYYILRPCRYYNLLASGILFSLAMYAYPPVRLQMPLTLAPILLFRYYSGRLTMKGVSIFLIAFFGFSLPLALQLISGNLMTRFNDISIFSKEYLMSIGCKGSWGGLLKLFVGNYLSHFRPDYLFLTGDANYIHSTRHFGILSWADIMGLVSGICIIVFTIFTRINIKSERAKEVYQLTIFLIICIFIAIIPAALTNDGLPHSLRTIGAWPFVILLTSSGGWYACRYLKAVLPIGIFIAGIFAYCLLGVYFNDYPKESKGMFGFWAREEALAARTEMDWLRFMYRYRTQDYHFRYYLMNNKGLGCSKTREMWFSLRDYLKAQGKY